MREKIVRALPRWFVQASDSKRIAQLSGVGVKEVGEFLCANLDREVLPHFHLRSHRVRHFGGCTFWWLEIIGGGVKCLSTSGTYEYI